MITLPFCSTLVLIAILWPRACELMGAVKQTGGYNFSIKGKKEKTNVQLVKPGAQLSNLGEFTFRPVKK